jgi:hypothetical protein
MDTVTIALTVLSSLGGIAVIVTLFIKAGEMKTKVDALWSVYEARLIEIAKRGGFGRSSSIIKLTEKGEGLLTEEIKEKSKEIVLKKKGRLFFKKNDALTDANVKAIFVGDLLDKIKESAVEKNEDVDTIISAVFLYADKIEALLQALGNEKWEWRTVDALVRESGMTEKDVLRTIEKHKKIIMKSSIPDRSGNELYTLRSRYIMGKMLLKGKLENID